MNDLEFFMAKFQKALDDGGVGFEQLPQVHQDAYNAMYAKALLVAGALDRV